MEVVSWRGDVLSEGCHVTCPQCGGAESRTIAPGYFECMTVSVVTHRDWVPLDATRPGGPMRPLDTQSHRPCAHRWHQRDASLPLAPRCSRCGTFAIGLCAECTIPVCGDHSKLLEPGRLCMEHAQQIEDERAAVRRKKADEARKDQARAKEALRLRDEQIETGFTALLEQLNLAGRPGIESRHHISYKDRLFSKRFKRVTRELEPGWKVGKFKWTWAVDDHGGRLSDYNSTSGQLDWQTAVLPNGEFVEADIDDLYRWHHALEFKRDSEQLARVNKILGDILGRATDKGFVAPSRSWRPQATGNVLWDAISQIRRAEMQASSAIDVLLEGRQGASDRARSAKAELEEAQADLATAMKCSTATELESEQRWIYEIEERAASTLQQITSALEN